MVSVIRYRWKRRTGGYKYSRWRRWKGKDITRSCKQLGEGGSTSDSCIFPGYLEVKRKPVKKLGTTQEPRFQLRHKMVGERRALGHDHTKKVTEGMERGMEGEEAQLKAGGGLDSCLSSGGARGSDRREGPPPNREKRLTEILGER